MHPTARYHIIVSSRQCHADLRVSLVAEPWTHLPLCPETVLWAREATDAWGRWRTPPASGSRREARADAGGRQLQHPMPSRAVPIAERLV